MSSYILMMFNSYRFLKKNIRYPLSVSDGWTNGSIKRFLDLRSLLTTDVGKKTKLQTNPVNAISQLK
jgi:hypothetical protein